LQGFPTARGSLPYSSLKIHLPILKEIPLSESKQAFAFANYNNWRERGSEVKNMTPVQEERMRELEDQAVQNYLEETNFDEIDWLDSDEEKKEYCELKNIEIIDFCICGQHKSS
jgi:hypothetical protein